MIAAPVVVPAGVDGLAHVSLWLPEGTFFDLVQRRIVDVATACGQIVERAYDVSELPLFARAGAIIPTLPYTGGLGAAMGHYESIELHVYPGDCLATSLYIDDGYSRAYVDGAFGVTNIACVARSAQSFQLAIDAEEVGCVVVIGF